jgi:7-cyano-7-deazaguanine reductase
MTASKTNGKTPKFKGLGQKTRQNYDNPDKSILEAFPTGQPDFATIIIDYQPDKFCVESKSLKLYLGAFRQFPEFHEGSINRISNDLISLLDPIALRVEGRFTPRGGIPFWPVANYVRPDKKR